jgi:hypothetical protein
MKRQLIAVIMILGLGLQGSLAAFAAAAPLMQSDCQTSRQTQDVADKSCCPRGVHTTSCCSDACSAAVAATVAASPAPLIWDNRTTPALRFGTPFFLSRDDSPLIRPPIL